MHKILLATDNSEQAEKAGEYAISMTKMEGTDIIVLYVIDSYYLDALPQPDLREKMDEQLREEGKEAVEKFEKKIEEEQCEGNCKNVNLITMIKPGKPSDVILETAEKEGVDQIIMGKSGKHGVEKFLLGNTAEKVLREAKIPVHVVS